MVAQSYISMTSVSSLFRHLMRSEASNAAFEQNYCGNDLTELQVAGYSGLLLSVPTVLYEIVAYVVPGLTRSERQLLAPIIFGSSILFYVG